MRVLLVLITCHLPLITASAQEEPEYKLEIGAGAGTVTYLGDFNGGLLQGVQPWGAVVAKYKMNPRMAVGVTLGYGRIKGSSDNVDTWYPQARYEFGTKMVNATMRYEYNFWPFGTGQEYYGAKPLTPFIALGAGLAFAKGDKSATAFQIPIGFGVKYKLQSRLNLTLEWMMHFSGSDNLDSVRDPYGIKSTELFKNTDCYQGLQLSLTYEFMEKCKTCHNDRD